MGLKHKLNRLEKQARDPVWQSVSDEEVAALLAELPPGTPADGT